ncbi:WHG domain-containing protein [Streptomyces sp. NBC_01728]|uniref:TetR-like C-terminal domain-containing protein n=1 Tax=unclassified Streptomyces TaxID=2593676 RepID=UPI00225354D9|nr:MULTISPECIES: TetR-like C-terminal domain-containing protein [unclassified Streptomyces]MCX4454631.1 WHG domain-containing protein [Streptomyces sp. NBC_01719]MCX4493991.1 WHG domain-containing protein [Streptomyces sp. NBC_01728]
MPQGAASPKADHHTIEVKRPPARSSTSSCQPPLAALAEATDLRDAGVHYVRFAREHPAHFQVMFTPELLRENDLELATARALTADRLRRAVSDRVPEPGIDPRLAGVAAWSLAHGFATLLLGHNLDGAVGDQDPEEVFRTLTGMLFPSPSA